MGAVIAITITMVSSLTAAPAAPVISATATTTQINLTCTVPTVTGQSVIAGYKWERASAIGGPYTLVGSSTATPAQTDAGSTSGFYYRVSAIDQFTTGVASAPVFAALVVNTGSIITVGVGKDFTTIGAAYAARTGTQTIQVYTGTYDERVILNKAGTAANRLTIDPAPGQSPIWTYTGSSSYKGQIAPVHVDVGGDYNSVSVIVQGNCDGTTTNWNTQPKPTRGINMCGGSNFTLSGTTQRMTQGLITTSTTVVTDRLRITNWRGDGAGTLDIGAAPVTGGTPHDDASDFVETPAGAQLHLVTNLLYEDAYVTHGGHSLGQFQGDNIRIRNVYADNKWNDVAGMSATAGNKGFDLYAYRGVVDPCIITGQGRQTDNPTTSAFINYSTDSVVRGLFILGLINTPGLFGISTNNIKLPGAKNCRYVNCTVWNMAGLAVQIGDFSGAQSNIYNWGSYKFYNCAFVGNAYNPDTTRSIREQGVMLIEYHSGGRGSNAWQTNVLFDSCRWDANQMVSVHDIAGVDPDITLPLQTMINNYPAVFPNCSIAAPNFVNAALPVSTVPATALAQAQANFTPQAASYIGTGRHVTTVLNAASATNTITLVDAGMLADAMGWPTLTGDTVFIEGIGARTITLISGSAVSVDGAPFSVGAGAKIWWGSSSAPSIGAVVNASLPATGGVLDDFEATNRSLGGHLLWESYASEGANATAVFAAEAARFGGKGLLYTLNSFSGTGGGIYLQFYSHNGSLWDFAHNFILSGTPWTRSAFNRLSFWVKHPVGYPPVLGGRHLIELGTYSKAENDTGNTSQGNHFYHYYDLLPGVWTKVILDNHAQHEVGGAPSDRGIIVPAANWNYHDSLTRFYWDAPYVTTHAAYPNKFYFDQFLFYNETGQDDVTNIASLEASYDATSHLLHLGFVRTNGSGDVTFTVRWSYTDINALGFVNATLLGTVSADGLGDYVNKYVNGTVSLTGPAVYIAVQAAGKSTFRQMKLELT